MMSDRLFPRTARQAVAAVRTNQQYGIAGLSRILPLDNPKASICQEQSITKIFGLQNKQVKKKRMENAQL
jgi:hypothetical protein